MNDPRIYRHTRSEMVLAFLAVFLLGIFAGVLAFIGTELTTALTMGVFAVFGAIYAVVMFSYSVSMSATGISSRMVWMEKSLSWSEIRQVKGNDNSLKLQDMDGSVTVAIHSHLPGFEEIVTHIGDKRPDLFAPPAFDEMRRGLSSILPIAIVLLVLAGGAFFLSQSGEETWILLVLFAALGLFLVVTLATAPRAVVLEAGALRIEYLFRERLIRAAEIQAAQLAYQNTRHGKVYFAQLLLVGGKKVKLTGLQPGAPVTYLALREWHKRQMGVDSQYVV
ncbi:MAG: hypothetical protein ACOYYU_05500 [Chloroflexota bacterium]